MVNNLTFEKIKEYAAKYGADVCVDEDCDGRITYLMTRGKMGYRWTHYYTNESQKIYMYPSLFGQLKEFICNSISFEVI